MWSISVIYEDDDVLVIDKPSGLVVHPSGRNRVHADGKTPKESIASYGAGRRPTLADWVLEQYPELEKVGEPWERDDPPSHKASEGQAALIIARPGIVHRLDRETSGALAIAKTQESFEHLKEQFSAPALRAKQGRDLASGGQNRMVEKTYNAFVYGNLPDDEGIIDRPIGKSAKDFRLRSAQRGARGKLRDAVTEYSVKKRLPEMTYVEVRPKTGRTHQIRAHFKAIHHPVVCDSLYAPKQECLGFSRLALHATKLSFESISGKRITAEAPLPEEFEQILNKE